MRIFRGKYRVLPAVIKVCHVFLGIAKACYVCAGGDFTVSCFWSLCFSVLEGGEPPV
jgi:hypothetical protein